MADELVVVSWNVKNNGGVNGGDVISLLQKLKPDILFRQGFSEVTHAGKIGLHGAGALLGLTPFSTEPKKGRSQNPVGVLVNPSSSKCTQRWSTTCLGGRSFKSRGPLSAVHAPSACYPHT